MKSLLPSMSTSPEPMNEVFSQDYFENGIDSGLSLYTDYRWLPELTIPMAASIAQKLCFSSNTTLLDYGCAKGYLVKAFKYLGYKAYGYDISTYAIENSDQEISRYLYSDKNKILVSHKFDWVVSKDVLEHVPYEDIFEAVSFIKKISNRSLIIVPLSRKSKETYIAPEYELDKTHIIREPVEWWISLFTSCGFKIDNLAFSMDGVKSAWFQKYPTANLFITLSS